MGTNKWRSSPSLAAMNNDYLKLYLVDEKTEVFHSLKAEKPEQVKFIKQVVDFSDRETWNNVNYYPDPIILDELNSSRGNIFVSEPMEETVLVNGSFEGTIRASINKKDCDIGVTLYELTPTGEYFHLSYIIFRTSYSKDITKRNLLTPNTIETIPFTNTHLISKQLEVGSRLVIFLDVNKNPFSQVNYGSGKDVSLETMSDAEEPLVVKWYNDSQVIIPIWKD